MSKIDYFRLSPEHQETARQQEIMCGYQVDRIFSGVLCKELAEHQREYIYFVEVVNS